MSPKAPGSPKPAPKGVHSESQAGAELPNGATAMNVGGSVEMAVESLELGLGVEVAQTPFQASVAALNEANSKFRTGKLSSVDHRWHREKALSGALVAMADELGAPLKTPIQIDSRGEYLLSTVKNGFGEAFVEILNRHHPRCGVVTTSHLDSRNAWCMVHHLNTERMVLEYAKSQESARLAVRLKAQTFAISQEDARMLQEAGFTLEQECGQYIDYESYPGGFGATEAQDDRLERITFCKEDGTFYAVPTHVNEDGDYWYEPGQIAPASSLQDTIAAVLRDRESAPKSQNSQPEVIH